MFMYFLAAIATMITPLSDGWNSYRNNQYGYTTCFTKSMTFSRDAADGSSLERDGSVVTQFIGRPRLMTVYVFNDMYYDSFDAFVNERETWDDSVQTTMQGNDWAIHIGRKDGAYFWRKDFRRGRLYYSFEFTGITKAELTDYNQKLNACTTIS